VRGIQGEGAGEGCDAAACCCDDSGGDDQSSVECATVDVGAATTGGYCLYCGRKPERASENRCGSLRTRGSSCRRHRSQITIFDRVHCR